MIVGMNKPKEIRTALLLLSLSLSLGVFRSLLDLFTHPENRPANVSIPANLLGIVSVSVIGFILIYQISKARNWARIVFTLLVVLACASLPYTLKNLSQLGMVNPISESLGLAQVLIQVAGVGLLYRPAARLWFRGKMNQT